MTILFAHIKKNQRKNNKRINLTLLTKSQKTVDISA